MAAEVHVWRLTKRQRLEFSSLFPGRCLTDDDQLHIVIVSTLMAHDNSAIGYAMMKEREDIHAQFIRNAVQFCTGLRNQSTGDGDVWADFADPSSGSPYFESSPCILSETDERWRMFGFEIVELGCCRAVRHPVWGGHVAIGGAFAVAPTKLVEHFAKIFENSEKSSLYNCNEVMEKVPE
eukprot:GHVT01030038.1.p1 GENE.GHVT01030038.1~~GHVT01030038.1.p1  ORF type:complete len:180 (+),score=29.45 GHVT01030038.1:1060-1599(+)